ncbi:hypothetical protein Pla123a_22480 [Posidoniimonas polymericola]|uniref:PEP-CTERM protein-sorting domain-containing protein n=1 Tax=Posidoniimonas polymericola TaxID=2528002 RepID=A0A5C5YPJ8_9BACT|nr:LamG domain-containing protein [Posidoniimonas polymericola]TWT76825.1 hypothetical protein Pla123a_22480 [Posidoniimonas polymericola]
MTIQSFRSRAARLTLAVTASAAILAAGSSQANTVAYWRFEDGSAGANVVHLAGDDAGNTYSADIADVSGNGNDLSAWITAGCCGFGYRDDTPVGQIAATGETNNLSIQNTGGGPGMFTGATGIQTIAPAAFTIEASFKPENGGFRTIVGRDSQGAATSNGDLAAVYFQITPANELAFKFTDQAGIFHEAISAPDTIQGYNFPNSADGTWYHAAGVSDGSTISLYLADAQQNTGYQLVAELDLTASGSTNTALTSGAGDGGDWDAGNWTVGRGMYAGGHGDRFYGFIDEVRISDDAVAMSDFLHFGALANLTLEVNTTSGAVTIRNTSPVAVDLDYYEVTSASGALSTAGWDSLEDQGVTGSLDGDFNADGTVDAADYTVYRDGLGTTYAEGDYTAWANNYGRTLAPGDDTWTEAGGSDANLLSELLLNADGTTLAPGASLSLGNGFSTGGLQDLAFSYGKPGVNLFAGAVSYVSSASAATAAPEPFAGTLLAAGMMMIVGRRRQR